MNEHEVRSQEQSARHLMERVGKARIEALERERDHNLDSINVGNAIINKNNERIKELEAALDVALEALESSRVFVTTREKTKHPEGTEWYDEVIAKLKEVRRD